MRNAQEGSPTALGQLLETYRPALVRYLASRLKGREDLRAKGRYLDDPEAIFQGFVEALLRREFLHYLTPSSGKLRSFLLRALDHFLADELERLQARKAGGNIRHVSRDIPSDDSRPPLDPPSVEPPPDRAFDRAWADSLLNRALDRLAASRRRRGQEALFLALRPFLWGSGEAAAYHALAERLSISDDALRVAVHRLRRELRELVHDEIRRTVASEADFEEERRHFMNVLRAEDPA